MSFFIEHLLFFHFSATVFMTGLLWMVQLVHYPLFLEVGAPRFTRYERLHQKKITPIVAPMMLFELFTSILLLLYHDSQEPLLWANAVLVLGIWISTFCIQMPLHFQLSKEGHDVSKIKMLVHSNWFRTIAWTLRFFLLGGLLLA